MAKTRPEPENSVESEQESEQEEEEEEAAASSDDNGSESEPETPLTQQPKTQSINKKLEIGSKSKPVSSSDESDSESEGLVKPIASKPMPAKNPRSKPAEAPSPAKSKRPAAAAAEEAKKPKKKAKEETKKSISEIEDSAKKSVSEDPKKQLFQRLWSEDDEIAVLKGMIDYAAEKNADPIADLNSFHDFIRKSLHISVTRTQLQDKIRRLRKKYENIAKKEKKGKERTFSKSHEQNAYELSKKIWGVSKTENGSVLKSCNAPKTSNAGSRKEQSKSAVKAAMAMDIDHVADDENVEVEKNVEATKGLSFAGESLFGKTLTELGEWIEKNKAGISEEKLSEIEGKWKALRVAEVELFLKKTALIQEQSKLVLDAMK